MASRMKIHIEDTPPDNDKDRKIVNTFLERIDDDIIITIQEQKRGGRWYHHSAKLPLKVLLEKLDKLA